MLSKHKVPIIFFLLFFCPHVFADVAAPYRFSVEPGYDALFSVPKVLPYLLFGWGILLYVLAFVLIARLPQDISPSEKRSCPELILTFFLPCLPILIIFLSDVADTGVLLSGLIACMTASCITDLAWIFLKQPRFAPFRSPHSMRLFAESCTILSAYLMYACLFLISVIPDLLSAVLGINENNDMSISVKLGFCFLFILLFVAVPFFSFLLLRISLFFGNGPKWRPVLLSISLVSFLLKILGYGAFLFQINFFSPFKNI